MKESQGNGMAQIKKRHHPPVMATCLAMPGYTREAAPPTRCFSRKWAANNEAICWKTLMARGTKRRCQ